MPGLRNKHLRVPVSNEEEAVIKAKAHGAGLSVAKYMRLVGMGYAVQSRIDNQAIEQLLKINADLGRAGGLLKMWLTNDVKVKIVGRYEIEDTLQSIRETQTVMLSTVLQLQKNHT